MKTKPYPQHEEKPTMANEPTVAYGSMATASASLYEPTPYQMEILRRSEEDSLAGRVYSQEDVDGMVAASDIGADKPMERGSRRSR